MSGYIQGLLYIGSKDLAEQEAKKISHALLAMKAPVTGEPMLAKPIDTREIEFAPGVIGRFTEGTNSQQFVQYGSAGICHLKEDTVEQGMKGSHKITPEVLHQLEARAYQALVKKHGAYFFGKHNG